MNKNELEISKLQLQAEKFASVINLLQHIVTAGTIVGSIYLIMHGLEGMVHGNAEVIGAISKVIENLHVNAILGYVIAGCTSLGYVYERKGKKRAIRNASVARAQVETSDSYKAASHLDENGHTPK